MKESKYNIDIQMAGRTITYNSLSKAFVNTNYFRENIEQDKEILYKNGFLIDDDMDEMSCLKYMYNNDYFNNDNLTIILTPTWKCNFDCPYCVEKNSNSVQISDQFFDVIKKFAYKYFKKYKHIHISLFGGEPLLLSNKIFDFLDYVQVLGSNPAYNYTLSTSITTNGSLLDRNIIEQLNKFNCLSAQITLDGDREKHNNLRKFKSGSGSFDILIDKIKMATRLFNDNCNFILRFNLENISEQAIEKVLLLFNEEEKKKINLLFRLIYNTKCYSEDNLMQTNELIKFYEVAKKQGFTTNQETYRYKPCEAGGGLNLFYILPDLSIWKCIHDLNIKEACIGNINEKGDLEIKTKNFINWYKASNWLDDVNCVNCKMLPDCMGGCIMHKIRTGEKQCRDAYAFSLPFMYR